MPPLPPRCAAQSLPLSTSLRGWPPCDAPKITRLVDQPVLVTALAAAMGKPGLEEAAEFLLANISQRLAQGLREEMAERGKIKDKDAEAAMAAVISAIRTLEASGEITLVQEEEE